MNARSLIYRHAATVILAATASSLFAAPTTPIKRPELPKSVFVMPESSKEGRDPFFPNSTRPYPSKSIPKPGAPNPVLTDLTVKSIYQGDDGRFFAMINNHVLGVGEDSTVTTRDGRRLTIHCLDINQKTGTVTVESSGTKAVLTLSNR